MNIRYIKNIKEKSVKKSVKPCNYPELTVQISGYIAKNDLIDVTPKKCIIIRNVLLSGDYCPNFRIM